MDDSDDEPIRVKKKIKIRPDSTKSSSSGATKRKRPQEPESVSSSTPKKSKTVEKGKTLKKRDKAERLQYAMQAFLWWNAEEPPEGCQWNTMEHAGVSFPENYVPHGVKMHYDGEPVDLTPVEEEA